MMKRVAALRSIAVYTTIATVGLGLTACAGSKQNSNNSTTGGNASTSAVLTIQGDSGDPTLTENVNPFTSTQLEGTRLIYEPLEIPSSIDGAYTPFLATANSFSNPQTLMFTLRSGVKWSDGQPMTAADVVFTFNLLKKFPALDTTGVWTQLSTVTGAADTVTMTFKTPSVPFASTVAQVPIVPEHLWKSIADPAKYTDTKPVGTGPFTLASFAPTQYLLQKNSSYWQADKIVPTKVKFPAQSSNQSTNQLDVTSGTSTGPTTTSPTYRRRTSLGTRTTCIGFRPGARSDCFSI